LRSPKKGECAVQREREGLKREGEGAQGVREVRLRKRGAEVE
jgi:hypothetical protein